MMFRFLTGVDNAHARELAESHGVGLMLQPRSYKPERANSYPVHTVDNGCFSGKWDEAQWLRYLDRVPRERCLFAVAPDVPFDWKATWARSERYVDRIRDMGFPVAIAAQNGCTPELLAWDAVDVLFLGGDTEWKLGLRALELTWAARDHGKPVHMGRANSLRRFRRAVELTVDTADGTFLKHGEPAFMAERLRVMLDEIGRFDGHQLALA